MRQRSAIASDNNSYVPGTGSANWDGRAVYGSSLAGSLAREGGWRVVRHTSQHAMCALNGPPSTASMSHRSQPHR